MAKRARSEVDRRPGPAGAALRGAVAGMAGGAVMAITMKAEQKAILPEGTRTEPPSRKLVEAEAEEHGVEISQANASAAGVAAHMLYSALVGAAFGLVERRRRRPSLLDGLVLGGLVYATNFPSWGLLPKQGALPPPTEQSIEEAAIPVGAHAAFGLTTAAALRAVS